MQARGSLLLFLCFLAASIILTCWSKVHMVHFSNQRLPATQPVARPRRAAARASDPAARERASEPPAAINPPPLIALARPKYMVVAVHSNVAVFPQMMKQVLPQVTKEWTVCFVAAIAASSPETPNWNVVISSEEHEMLSSVVHSITFAEIATDSARQHIANAFAYNHSFWNATPEDIQYFWLIQDDTAICSTNSPWCIQDFLEWDYLGAEWKDFANVSYGNGAFSLRSRRLQVECSEPGYFKAHDTPRVVSSEDYYFSVCLRNPVMHFRVAPLSVVRHFASERPMYIGSLGWHLQSSVRRCNEKMIRYCPEGLYSYKKWGCGVPRNVPPVNVTSQCRTRPKKAH